ncbi:uncharacterized protein Dyak_GE27462 [Drosophila yakuba]|uniref:Uncharacterized protein n=1 Tax=Drosophila yakuba TaxID=7245 RepID=A0A0R1DYB5_DROYA|nr:uncharacterized protein Dyak_GE27462 [Drosophila yakuba]
MRSCLCQESFLELCKSFFQQQSSAQSGFHSANSKATSLKSIVIALEPNGKETEQQTSGSKPVLVFCQLRTDDEDERMMSPPEPATANSKN